jgi:hypothetical protein
MLALVAVACGRFGVQDNAQPLADASADALPDIEEAEPRVTAFACGDETCHAGEEVCCAFGMEKPACRSLDAGCGGEDGGALQPGLACTTSTLCSDGRVCCYAPDAGASCKEQCAKSEARLCVLGADNCGRGSKCKNMANPPVQGVGACANEDGKGP